MTPERLPGAARPHPGDGTAWRRRLVSVLAMAGLLASPGCVGMPESGPVVETSVGADPRQQTDNPIDITPPGPQPGETPPEIVDHFLDAMTAAPVRTDVAREFLTRQAASSWSPDREVITYADTSRPQGTTSVRLRLFGANRLDAAGAWKGRLPRRRADLSFPMAIEDGQWRISAAPDALIVPEWWFGQAFEHVSLYFFDPTASILVPEPAFVPRGDQFVTSLTERLLRGPDPGLSRVVRSFLPRGASLRLSVPVSAAGVADVTLRDPATLSPEASELALTQLAWTLRQDPDIRTVRLSPAGSRVGPEGEQPGVGVEVGAGLDPAVLGSSRQLFGLADGLVVTVSDGAADGLDGPMGTTPYDLRDLAVDLTAERVAGVTADGSRILTAPLDTEGTVREVVSGGRDLTKPVWDHAGRLWVLDRTADGAGVAVLVGRRLVPIEVPGVTGRRVTDFLVSRDGSRLVAVLGRPGSDQVVVSRIEYDDRGRVLGATRARVIAGGTRFEPFRVRDVGWRSPTVLAVVTAVTEDRDEVRLLPVDGSPLGVDAGASRRLLRDRVRRLVSSPQVGATMYVVTRTGVQDPADPDIISAVEQNVRALTYAG